jgi:hypothetical protein
MDQYSSTDRELIEELQRSCPSFIDSSDLFLFQANLYIQAARTAADHPARRYFQSISLSLSYCVAHQEAA